MTRDEIYKYTPVENVIYGRQFFFSSTAAVFYCPLVVVDVVRLLLFYLLLPRLQQEPQPQIKVGACVCVRPAASVASLHATIRIYTPDEESRDDAALAWVPVDKRLGTLCCAHGTGEKASTGNSSSRRRSCCYNIQHSQWG